MADTIESVDVAGVHGQVALNPDGTAIGTPVGGATSANQTNGSQKTQIVDGSGNVIGSTANALDVNIASGSSSGIQYTEGDTDSTITGTAILFESNTTTSAVSTVSADNPLPVSVTGGGDATAANQTTIIGHVDGIETLLGTIDADTSSIATDTSTIAGDTTSIDAKTPALGQALASASVPVVLPAAQVTTLTPQTDALTDTQLRATPVPVSGSLTVDLGANNDVTVTGTVDLGATDNAVLDTIAAKDFATQTTLAAINAKMVTGTDIGDVTINNASGASAVNIQDGGNTITVDGTVSITANSAVNVAQMNGTAVTMGNGVSGTGVQRVTIASDSTGVVGLATGSNAIGKLAANSGVDIGDVDVTSISAGSNLIGNVGIGVRTSGGTTLYKNIDVDETEDEVKGSAGQVYWIHAINLTAAPIYLKFYNATAANVTVGTTTPDLTFPVPANADSDGAGFTLSIANGIAFSTAITIAGTTGVADNDTGAPAANALVVNLGYN